jgi:hypothetical protein
VKSGGNYVSEEHIVSVFRIEAEIKQETSTAACLLQIGFLFSLLYDSGDRGDMFFRNVG